MELRIVIPAADCVSGASMAEYGEIFGHVIEVGFD